jgi:hypothetical protein
VRNIPYNTIRSEEYSVRDDPNLPDDSGEVPKPNRVVGGLIPNCEIVFLLDRKPTRWSSTFCVPINNYNNYNNYNNNNKGIFTCMPMPSFSNKILNKKLRAIYLGDLGIRHAALQQNPNISP